MKTDKYKNKLEEEKKILEDELSELGKLINKKTDDWEAAPESEMNTQEVQNEGDMAERSEDFEERSSQLNVLETRLLNIDGALNKIKNNKFGICETCGVEIEEDRLEANPAAQSCKNCM